MTEEQKRAAYNAVVGALITLGVTNRDALYAAEAAVQCLTKWDAQLLNHAAAEQHRLDNEDRAGYLTEREAYTRRLRADISPEEAAEELMSDPDEWDGQ